MPPVDARIRTEHQLLRLEWGVEELLDANNLSFVLNRLGVVFLHLASIPALPGGMLPKDTDHPAGWFYRGEGLEPTFHGRLAIVSISYNSPLKMVFAAFGVAKPIGLALVSFLKGVIFYEETRSRMQAEGRLVWEQAREQKLKNVQTAVNIVRSLAPDAPVDLAVLEHFMNLHDELDHGPVKLLEAELVEDN